MRALRCFKIHTQIPHAKTCNEIFDWWKKRWAEQRFAYLTENNKLKS